MPRNMFFFFFSSCGQKSSDVSPEQSKKSPPDQTSVRKAKIQSGLRFANESEQEAARKRDQRRRALEYADKVQRTRREKHSVSNRHPSDLSDSDSRLNSRTSATDVPSSVPVGLEYYLCQV